MNCYNTNPHANTAGGGYYSTAAGTTGGYYNTVSNTAGAAGAQYVQTGPWGEEIAVNPTTNPSSPFSVQPLGTGTQLTVDNRMATLPSASTAVTGGYTVQAGYTTQPAPLPGTVTTLPAPLPGTVAPIPTPPITMPEPLPETLSDTIYTPAWLRENIGKLVRVDFLIGDRTTDRTGYLREVGASYIVLEAVDYASLIMCDLYAIKFVTILLGQQEQQAAILDPTQY